MIPTAPTARGRACLSRLITDIEHAITLPHSDAQNDYSLAGGSNWMGTLPISPHKNNMTKTHNRDKSTIQHELKKALDCLADANARKRQAETDAKREEARIALRAPLPSV